MQSKDFATRTMTISRKNVTVPNNFLVALDIGYSSVKGFSPNKAFCFPSFVHRSEEQQEAAADDIQYKDEDGLWVVGEAAMRMMTSRDLSTSDEVLFARQRYTTKEFQVLARTGIAIGMMPNEYGTSSGKTLLLQTGLPPKYIRNDAPVLREVFTGKHKFSVRVGSEKWRDFDVKFTGSSIFIMSQPMGSLYSVSLDRNARQITSARNYFSDGTVIFDGGFGTLDIFSVRSGAIENSTTIGLSMRDVLRRTADEVYHLQGIDCQVYEILTCLSEGKVRGFDAIKKAEKTFDFSKVLDKNCKAVCDDALRQLDSIYNNLMDYHYLVVAGGTGEAWLSKIRAYYANRSWLEVIPSTQNDDLLSIFSNVRGYYMYRAGQLKRGGV